MTPNGQIIREYSFSAEKKPKQFSLRLGRWYQKPPASLRPNLAIGLLLRSPWPTLNERGFLRPAAFLCFLIASYTFLLHAFMYAGCKVWAFGAKERKECGPQTRRERSMGALTKNVKPKVFLAGPQAFQAVGE